MPDIVINIGDTKKLKLAETKKRKPHPKEETPRISNINGASWDREREMAKRMMRGWNF